ncbi:hypothetical protein [Streptomyces sp. NPDC053431]|uniref:hypothetical protein n=1 Tax=Streptomyces sp. NPDC053431 TaxID=3365703 RepID=UPI0037D191C8
MNSVAAFALAVFLAVVGLAHFVVPGYFRGLVPSWLRGARWLVAGSGAAEIVLAVLVLLPDTRAAGGWAAAALITSYLASHLDALTRTRPDKTHRLERPVGVVARLVVNLLYIAWAVAVATS